MFLPVDRHLLYVKLSAVASHRRAQRGYGHKRRRPVAAARGNSCSMIASKQHEEAIMVSEGRYSAVGELGKASNSEADVDVDDDVDDDDELVVQFGLKANSINYSFAGSPVADKRRRTKTTKSIPRSLRWMVNAASLTSCLFFSGIIYGWAPLKLILMRENQFASSCGNDATTHPCPSQLAEYNAMFTAAQFVLSFASLPVGIFLDHAPKAVYYAMAAALQWSGLLLFGASDATSDNNSNNHFLLAYILMALGGCMTMLGAFPASFLLPEVQAGLLASISCLFDASSILFSVFHQLYNYNSALFSRCHLFYSLAAWSAVVYSVLIYGWYQLEKCNWALVVEEEGKQSRKQQQQGDKDDETNDQKSSTASRGWHMDRIQHLRLHKWSLRRQLGSLEFGLVVVFASVQMTRCNFFIETVNELLLTYGDVNSTYATLFSYVLPAGVIFVPLIESSVRHRGCVGTLHVTNVLGAVFGILLLVPSLPVQAVNFAIFACFRAFLYATLNTFIAFSFGVQTMGRVVGCTFTTAAVVTLVQYPAAALAETGTAGEGVADFTLINSLMLAACLVPTVLALCYSRMLHRTAGVSEESQDYEKPATATTVIDGEGAPLLKQGPLYEKVEI